jgi:hypothetical protein
LRWPPSCGAQGSGLPAKSRRGVTAAAPKVPSKRQRGAFSADLRGRLTGLTTQAAPEAAGHPVWPPRETLGKLRCSPESKPRPRNQSNLRDTLWWRFVPHLGLRAILSGQTEPLLGLTLLEPCLMVGGRPGCAVDGMSLDPLCSERRTGSRFDKFDDVAIVPRHGPQRSLVAHHVSDPRQRDGHVEDSESVSVRFGRVAARQKSPGQRNAQDRPPETG